VTRLHHVAVGSSDVERLARFYREVFILTEATRHHDERGVLRSIWLDLGEAWLMIEHSNEPVRVVHGVGSGPFLLALRVSVAERQRLERELESLGHAIESRTQFTSYTRDPDGNRVAFSHYPDSAQLSHGP
jgi:glyoxylase I family protein